MKGRLDPEEMYKLRVERALRSLGNTSQAVAEKLRAARITGDPWDPQRNPVAEFLNRELAGTGEAIVSPEPRAGYYAPHAVLTMNGRWETQLHYPVKLPMPVRDFLIELRQGKWPDLDAHGARPY
jgi:hypothetical protein